MLDMAIKRKNENLEVLETTELGRKKEKETQFTEVKDSGKRQEFHTGSVRDSREGKGRYDLLSTIGLRRLAIHYENGARKYSDRNWEKGQPLSRFLDSAMRHLIETLECKKDEDHPISCVWNMIAFVHIAEMIQQGKLPKELDDIGWLQEKKIDT